MWLVLAVAVLCLSAIVLVCNLWVVLSTRRYTHDLASEVPFNDYAVVLGTSPYRSDGRPNRYYVRRINAASCLYKAGKVRHLVVSGAKNKLGYDEPQAMSAALQKAGVPEAAVVLHGGGFRTLMSVIYAHSRLGLRSVTFISQRFHNERAIFLARCMGMQAVGYNAEAVYGGKAPVVTAREWLSRVRAVGEGLSIFAKRQSLGLQASSDR